MTTPLSQLSVSPLPGPPFLWNGKPPNVADGLYGYAVVAFGTNYGSFGAWNVCIRVSNSPYVLQADDEDAGVP